MKLDARLPTGRSHTVEITAQGGKAEILLDGRLVSVRFRKLSELRCVFDIEGRIVDAVVHRAGAEHTVIVGRNTYTIELIDRRLHRPSEDVASGGIQSVKAQMPGRVVKLLRTAGDAVQKNTGILVVEAMKMQNEVRSPRSGVVAQIAVVEGQSVSAGQLLFEVS